MKYVATVNGNEYIVDVTPEGAVTVDGQAFDVDLQDLGQNGLLSIIVDGRSYEAAVNSPEREQWHVLLRGEVYDLKVQDERAYRLAKARGELGADTGTVPTQAPMPGVVVKVPVSVGDSVTKGQTLVILESMKMENELKATRDGVVLEVKNKPGDSVEKNAVIVVVGDEAADG